MQLGTRPTRKWPTFSLGRGGNRPSTSSSDILPVSASPGSPQTPRSLRRPTTSPGTSNQIPEIQELSPLGGSSIHPGFMGNTVNSMPRQNSLASLNPPYSSPPTSNPAYPNSTYFADPDVSHSPVLSQQLHPSRSASFSAVPTLPVPRISTSLPTRLGPRSPADRSVSHDSNFSLPARSVLTSNSSAHLSGPVREAVTDPRIVVNVNETGVVQSGTLEGLVERLIINFSECCCLTFQSRI